jgi:hypothetical protein
VGREIEDLKRLVDSHDKLIASLLGSVRGSQYVLQALVGTHRDLSHLQKAWRDVTRNVVDYEMDAGYMDDENFRQTFMDALSSTTRLIEAEIARRRS